MRLILTILVFISLGANATNYYVSNSGSDSNDGLTTATAWQTLSKVNSFSSVTGFNAGDSLLLNRGDSWNEKLRIVNSGSEGNHIVVSAYGTGNKPLITGFQTLTGLTNVGNVWSAIASNTVSNLNTVLVNGIIRAKGRYPNANAANGGYLTAQSGTQYSLTSSSLTGTPSYVGKECVLRTAVYILDVVRVSSQSSSVLNFDRPLTYTNFVASGGNGFFFQNDSTFLDQEGEWSCDSLTKKFCVYSASLPVVQVSTIDSVIYLNHNSYITFDNLSVQGANVFAFQFDSLSNVTIQNCAINYTGTIGVDAKKSSYVSIINDSIENSLSGAIYCDRLASGSQVSDTCNNTTVINCYIKKTGLLAGMGHNGNGMYNAINIIGKKSFIKNNVLDSTGYYVIFFRGDTSIVENNYVTNFCMIKNDGGGIGTAAGSGYPDHFTNGIIIRKNIVINGFYPSAGTTVDHPSACIYIDNYAKNVTIDSNFIYNGIGEVFESNSGDSNTITNNIMANGNGEVATIAGNNTLVTNGNKFKFNQLYSYSPSVITLNRTFGTTLGDCDSNYYSRPSNEYLSLRLNGNYYNLTDWQRTTGKDLNSHITPPSISKGVTPLIIYNPTLSDSTIYFSGYKRSLDGTDYSGSITLTPFSGAILFEYVPPYKSTIYKHYR